MTVHLSTECTNTETFQTLGPQLHVRVSSFGNVTEPTFAKRIPIGRNELCEHFLVHGPVFILYFYIYRLCLIRRFSNRPREKMAVALIGAKSARDGLVTKKMAVEVFNRRKKLMWYKRDVISNKLTCGFCPSCGGVFFFGAIYKLFDYRCTLYCRCVVTVEC